MKVHTKIQVDSYSVTIYLAGELADAKRSLRRVCLEAGLCVTVTPTTFVYTGGAEEGVAVGLVHYPRFPTTPARIWERACQVAEILMIDLDQWSALVVSPADTLWLSRKPEDK